ncbi:MAG: hypothetical protein GXO29_00310 [Thermotogae bacterium]|nr:hypothetical protein [Thermotogota bacterium]
MEYREVLRRLYSLANYERTKGFVKDIGRFRALLRALGDPHILLRAPLLVAGTKGKGSVVHMLARSLSNLGYRTGMNISPHLVSIHERIQIDGTPISEEDFAEVLGELFRVSDMGFPTTFFEAMTGAAILHFLRKGTDYQVFEVGLGGRLDATNVVEQKVGVITRIDYDHTSILGETLEEIAAEKAGIIKGAAPIITPESNSRVLPVIERRARRFGAPVVVVSHRVLSVGEEGTVFETDGRVVRLPVLGEFQAENGALAYHALKSLGLEFDPTGVFVPGRMHILRRSPLLLVDGAHNPVSAKALVSSLRRIFPHRKFNFVLAFSRGKDYYGFIRTVADVADWIFITRYPWRRSLEPEEVFRTCMLLHGRCGMLGGLHEILNRIHGDTVITGSLYLIGSFLRLFAYPNGLRT